MAQQDAVAAATGAETFPVTLALTTADIKSMSLSSTGGLIITKADGSTLIVENFKEMAEHRAQLTLANGETLDAEKLFETLSAGQSFSTPDVVTNPAITITGPQPATVLSFTLEEGQLYVFEFDPKAQDARIENGALILTFANGGTVILNNYEQALTSSNPAALTVADGAVIDGIGLLDFARAHQDETGQDQADIRRGEQEENLANLAQELAKVEPAAGDSGGAGSRGGFGFQSAVDDAPLGSPAPIGPIGPTALQFGLPEFDERVFAENEQPGPLPPGKPGLEVEDVFVDEDGSVLLNVSVSSNNVPNVNTSAVISGIPASWTVDAGLGVYDPVAGTWTIVLNGGGDFNGGPVLYPPHDSDVDLPNLVLTVTNTDISTGLTSSLSGNVNVFVDAIADKPDLATHNASGLEDTALPVAISTAVTDTDGSESITHIVISGVPAGFTLSAGTDLGGGSYQLTPAQLAGLTMTPPLHYSGSISLVVTTYNAETTLSGSEIDPADNTNSNTGELTLSWTPVADVPSLEVSNALINEDDPAGPVQLQIEANLVDNDGSEFLTVTVQGIPAGWTVSPNGGVYNAATGTWSITLAPGLNFSGGPGLYPPHDSDVDTPPLTVTATATEVGNGDAASNSGTAFVIVDAVADVPVVDGQDNSGAENTALAVNISGAVTDLDGSESITHYQISGVPAGFGFSAGTDLGGGVWQLSPAQLAGLTATAPANFVGSVPLTVTVFSGETNLSDVEPDFTDNTSSASDPFTLTWKPVVNPPTVEANLGVDDAIVKEDGSVFVPITASLDPAGSGNEILTVTVTGLNSTWTILNADGVYNPATGTWTITMAPGQNYSGGLTFVPPANSDLDMNGLVATATAFEPATATSASVTDGFRVVTDAVIDTPNLTATSPGGEEDHPIALNIATSVTDPDGSEAITHLTISGVPAGASLNHGTDLGGGVWQLTTAQLAGLHLNPPTGFSGNIALSVTTYASEVNLGGTEVDFTDNDAAKTVTLNVTVTPDDVPVLVQPEVVTVDETNLAATGTVSISDSIQANFFSDAPGSFAATGGFTSAIPLFSNGVPVTVTLTGDTYSGVAGTDPIFTLKVNGDGTYTFSLTGVLDHPNPADTNENIAMQFGISATDSDGDTVTGTVTVNVLDDAPKANDDYNHFDLLDGGTNGNVISGLNGGAGAADLGSQDVPNKVTAISFGTTTVAVPATGEATIKGDHGTLTIKSDGSYTYVLDSAPTAPAQDYNIAMMLDVSGSMGSNTDPTSRISLLVDAVKNLMADFNAYTNGTITVHLVPFSTNSGAGATFTVTDAAGFASVLNYLDTLTGNGFTNYEAPLQAANAWLASLPVSDAKTISYFVSDGEPNRYIDSSGNVTTGTLSQVLAQLNGTADGSNDIATLQSLSDEVIGVGINVGSAIANINVIDSDGAALNVNDPADMDAILAITNPVGNVKPTTDQFVYTLTDADGDPAQATLTLESEPPVILPPSIVVNGGVDNAIVKEDGSVYVPVVATLDPAGPATQVLTVTVTGINPAWNLISTDGTYNAATGTWTITMPAGQNYNGGLTFAPPANSDIDHGAMVGTAKATEPVTGQTASVNDGFHITTDAVADKPTLDATGGSANENQAIAVHLTAALTDTDGSEIITGYQIGGVPAGFSFNQGTNAGGGVWTFTPAQIAGLKMLAPTGFNGSVNLTAKVLNTENPVSDGEVDFNDNNNSATDTLTLTWNPVINPPEITVNNGIDDAIVKEDGSVIVPITATLGVSPAAGEFLTVTVTGINPAWGFSAPVGAYNAATGTWTVTLAAGQNLNTAMTFTPPANSDIDLNGLVATVVATDPASGLTASDNDGFRIITDAVADQPTISASAATAEQGHPVAISISSAVTDTDGSEIVTGYQISGVPAGFSFNQGADLGGGVWAFTPAQIAGLQLIAPANYYGNQTLTVKVLNTENPVSDGEADYTDNNNFNTAALNIHITRDDTPLVVNPPAETVDETALAAGTITVSRTISADFFGDAPGTFAPAGAGTFAALGSMTGGTLTSGGVPVTVTVSGDTFTGKAGSEPVFTLKVASDGTYTFTLLGTLDHADTSDPNDQITLRFGFNATDSDNDSVPGTILVNVLDDGVTAHDDVNTFDHNDGSTSGNVITGVNGGPGAADLLSQDDANTITRIAFGGTSVDVPATGTVSIDGDYGTLTIAANGSYTYTLDPASVTTTTTSTMKTLTLASAAYGVKITVDAVESASGVTFTIKLVQGIADLNGFFLDIDGNGGTIYSVGSSGNNMSGASSGFDYGYVLGSVGGNDADVTTATVTVSGIDLADLEDAIVGIRATSVGECRDASVKLTGVVDVETETHATDPVCGVDQFQYTLADGDGDTSVATLSLECVDPVLLVGENVDDKTGSTTLYEVGNGNGVITGGEGADILIGDVGGATQEANPQDYNIVMMLDVSGSMGSKSDPNSKISLLVQAVKNLIADFNAYDNGAIRVKLINFSTGIASSFVFTATNDSDYASAITFLNGLSGSGFTNYEAPMQQAVSWLSSTGTGSSNPIAGATTISYFISDGEPNRYLDNSGNVQSGTAGTVMGQLNGTDGTNEIAQLKALSDEVIGVGIDIGATTLANINQIDSNGSALNIDNPQDLDAALAATNPLNRVSAVGNDTLSGGDGHDIIYGDAVNTDALAAAMGLTAQPGTGWEVFARLEAGESALNPGWTRTDTIAYIRAHATELAAETLDSDGAGRSGGDDTINGGAGNDLIFGQEGDDIITGGAGNDLLYGGSGADQFVYNAATDGTDSILDFDVTEGDVLDLSVLLGDAGFDPVNDAITSFVFATDTAQGTVIKVDATGSGNASVASAVAVLDGVHGVTLNDLLTNGNLTTS